MIVNIRGTSGSGKSTIIHTLLKKYPWEATDVTSQNKPNNYKVTLPGKRKPLFVVGRYTTQCGGCDGVPYAEIWPRVERFAAQGHVLFEGLLITGNVGTIGRAMAARRDTVIAFLDTPLEVCLERIRARRAAKGNFEPLKPKHTVGKYNSDERTKAQLAALGVRCVVINHKRAFEEIMGLLK